MNLEKIISYALLVPMDDPKVPDCVWGLPVLFWGDPGIGKSDRIRAGAAAVNLQTEVVIPSQRQPEDFSGVPVLNPKGGLEIECILGAVRKLMPLKKGLLFIDEVSCARPAVQGALLSAVHDRRIGDTELPPGIRILLAANPEDSAAGGWELSPPLANRMAHIDVSCPSPDEWVSWLLGLEQQRSQPIEAAQEIVTNYWSEVWPRARGLMAGFMRARGELLHKIPKAGSEDRGRAWPSPRTWELATRAVSTCLALEVGEGITHKDAKGEVRVNSISRFFVEACVGHAASVEWETWVAKSDLPDPLDVIMNGWDIDTRRLDRTMAVLSSVGTYTASEHRERKERERLAIGSWRLVSDVVEAGCSDIAAVLARILSDPKVNLGYGSDNKDIVEACSPVILKLNKNGTTGLMASANKR